MNTYSALTNTDIDDITAISDFGSSDWMLKAKCRSASPTKFFPSDGSGVGQAILVCQACPVRTECLAYALVNHIEHGVWGGTSERERSRIQRRRTLMVDEFSGPLDDDAATAA